MQTNNNLTLAETTNSAILVFLTSTFIGFLVIGGVAYWRFKRRDTTPDG